MLLLLFLSTTSKLKVPNEFFEENFLLSEFFIVFLFDDVFRFKLFFRYF